jgi:phosphate transport system ATP-binding protein
MESGLLNIATASKMDVNSQNISSEAPILKAEDFSASFGSNQVLKKVNLAITRNHVVAVIGPSGCGKTTFVRCINRMHELTPQATVDAP